MPSKSVCPNRFWADLELWINRIIQFIRVLLSHYISFHNYLIHKAGGDDLVNIWYPFVMRMRLNYKRITSGDECVNEHVAIVNALRDGDIAKAVKGLKANIR